MYYKTKLISSFPFCSAAVPVASFPELAPVIPADAESSPNSVMVRFPIIPEQGEVDK